MPDVANEDRRTVIIVPPALAPELGAPTPTEPPALEPALQPAAMHGAVPAASGRRAVAFADDDHQPAPRRSVLL